MRKDEMVYAKQTTYGLSDRLPENDKRHPDLKKQRRELGFDETEFWSLELAVAKFMLPRLKIAKKNNLYPHIGKDLDKMIAAFELICRDEMNTDKEEQAILDGLKAFYVRFQALWW